MRNISQNKCRNSCSCYNAYSIYYSSHLNYAIKNNYYLNQTVGIRLFDTFSYYFKHNGFKIGLFKDFDSTCFLNTYYL